MLELIFRISAKIKNPNLKLGFYAEREGFEPPVHCCTMVFKTTAFDHSAISPVVSFAKIEILN
tara:strand:+ start:118 stop:306 length:189 start_codon:yes stop_codon:yes gene_type:complete